MRIWEWIAVVAVAIVPSMAAAQAPAPAPQLAERVAQLPAVLRGEADYDAYFDAGFRTAVPKASFDAMTAQITGAHGPATGAAVTRVVNPWAAEIRIDFRDGVGTATIAVVPNAPHQVSGLRLTGISGREASVEDVAKALAALPGTSGFAVARLGDGAPRLLHSANADRPLAVGSAFKLVILAELVRATNAGERKWTDTVTIDGKPLPGGAYTFVPAGSKVTLRELAERMISVSDNSATDILLFHLGRDKVEAMLPLLGVREPARLRPFLSTAEMFKLKGVNGGALGRRYVPLDEVGRRALLAGEVAAAPLTAVDPLLFRDGKPKMIDTIEWFVTPTELLAITDWLRRNSEGPTGAEARAILSKNPGLPPAAAGAWQFAGFKGGSEPGVINLTYLLQGKDGGWYAIAASWNNPAAEVDNTRFAGLLARMAELAAPK